MISRFHFMNFIHVELNKVMFQGERVTKFDFDIIVKETGKISTFICTLYRLWRLISRAIVEN